MNMTLYTKKNKNNHKYSLKNKTLLVLNDS